VNHNGSTALIGSYGPVASALPIAYSWYHTPSQHSLGATEVNFATGASSTLARPFGLRDVHPLLMFFSWGMVLTFGMLWARYTRHLPNAIWFKVHRVTQYGGYGLAIVGFIIAFFIVAPGLHLTKPHHIVGTFIMILGFLQVVVAFFRPHKEKGQLLSIQRVAFEYFHWWAGRLLIVLVLYQVFSGIMFIYPDWLVYLYAALLGSVLLIIIVQEIINCTNLEDSSITPCWKCYDSTEIETM